MLSLEKKKNDEPDDVSKNSSFSQEMKNYGYELIGNQTLPACTIEFLKLFRVKTGKLGEVCVCDECYLLTFIYKSRGSSG